MEIVIRQHRPFARLRCLGLFIAAIFLANALALLMTGPPPPTVQEDVMAGPMVHAAPPSQEAMARAQAVEEMGRIFTFLALNTVAISSVLFYLLARRMESRRRDRIGLPDGADEAVIMSPINVRPVRPRAANEYRPSSN